MKKWKWIGLSVSFAILVVIGYYAFSLYSFADRIQKNPEDSIFKKFNTTPLSNKTGEDISPPKWEGKERVNILMLGGDSRGLKENEVPRSDSIMVASIDPVTKKGTLFSILRDTYVDIPGHGKDRINAAITIGGPDLAMKTVGNLLGIPIQYYVYTDFKGFIALVDAVGGIDLDVEKDMNYTDSADDHIYDIHLKKGYQHLDGKTALQYVRFRHDAMSDFSRTERQRKFMTALAVKLKTSTSILKLPHILQSIDPYIETNLSITEMIKLASLGFEVKTEGLLSQQVPPMELLEEERIGGAAVIGVDPNKLHPFIHGLLGDYAEDDVSYTSLSYGAGVTGEEYVDTRSSRILASKALTEAYETAAADEPAPTSKPRKSPSKSAAQSSEPKPTEASAALPETDGSAGPSSAAAGSIDSGAGTANETAQVDGGTGSTAEPATEETSGSGSTTKPAASASTAADPTPSPSPSPSPPEGTITPSPSPSQEKAS